MYLGGQLVYSQSPVQQSLLSSNPPLFSEDAVLVTARAMTGIVSCVPDSGRNADNLICVTREGHLGMNGSLI